LFELQPVTIINPEVRAVRIRNDDGYPTIDKYSKMAELHLPRKAGGDF
jgi:hypothetical protein